MRSKQEKQVDEWYFRKTDTQSYAAENNDDLEAMKADVRAEINIERKKFEDAETVLVNKFIV